MASAIASTTAVVPRPRRWEIAAVATATVVPGFVTLALLGSLESYPRQREVASEFALLDGAVYGLTVLICIALPVYAAARDQRLHGATLNVIASLVFLPGLLTAVIWGMENLRAVDRVTRQGADRGLPSTLLLRTGGDWDKAAALDTARVRGLHLHWTLQRYGAGLLMTIGLTYLALTLLRP